MASPPPLSTERSALLMAASGVSSDRDEDSTRSVVDEWIGTGKLLRSLGMVILYLVVGILVFALGGMHPLDAAYFCIVTLTTVGYGDLSAHSAWAKIFACAYIIVGVALIGAVLSQLVEMLLENQERVLLSFMEEDKRQVRMGSKRNIIRANAQQRILEHTKAQRVKVLSGVMWFALLMAVGTVVFVVCDQLSALDAIYLTIVSASTVGYGDFSPQHNVSRVFAIFFLPLSTLLLAKIISDYTEMRVEANTIRRQQRILMAALSRRDFDEMDSDGDGKLTLKEYICGILIEQGKISREDVVEIEARFAELDRNADGVILGKEVSPDASP